MPVNIRLEINSQKTNQNQVIQSYGHYEWSFEIKKSS